MRCQKWDPRLGGHLVKAAELSMDKVGDSCVASSGISQVQHNGVQSGIRSEKCSAASKPTQ